MDKLQETATPYPKIIIPIVGDVTSKDSLASVAEQIRAESGHVNLLIANSGVTGPMVNNQLPKNPTLQQFKDLAWEKWSVEEFQDCYKVNDTAVFFTAVAFLEVCTTISNSSSFPSAGAVSSAPIRRSFIPSPAYTFSYDGSKAKTK